MQDIICKVFDENMFEKMDVSWNGLRTTTYTNPKSETYIIVYIDGFPEDLYTEIMDLCTNKIFTTDQLTKAQKSNLYIVIASKVEEDITDAQYNHIYKIEENNLYYKKYFFWYTHAEVESLKTLLENNFTSENMNEKLIDYSGFKKFKDDDNDIGYSLLSRLYIKFAFLTLAKISTLNKTLVEYIEESINELNSELFKSIVENFEESEDIDKEMELINLSEKELSDIDKLMEEVKL